MSDMCINSAYVSFSNLCTFKRLQTNCVKGPTMVDVKTTQQYVNKARVPPIVSAEMGIPNSLALILNVLVSYFVSSIFFISSVLKND